MPLFKRLRQDTKLDLTMQTMYVRHNIEARSRSNCCRGKSVLHISVCARVLACARARGRVHARACMWTCLSSMQFVCAMLSLNLWLLWLHSIFPHYLINNTIFGKMLLNIKCVFWFSLQLLSEVFIILRRIYRDITNVHTSFYKVLVILVGF